MVNSLIRTGGVFPCYHKALQFLWGMRAENNFFSVPRMLLPRWVEPQWLEGPPEKQPDLMQLLDSWKQARHLWQYHPQQDHDPEVRVLRARLRQLITEGLSDRWPLDLVPCIVAYAEPHTWNHRTVCHQSLIPQWSEHRYYTYALPDWDTFPEFGDLKP